MKAMEKDWYQKNWTLDIQNMSCLLYTSLRIPPQAMEEYHIADEGKVYLFTGSKITGGFCVTRKMCIRDSYITDMSNKCSDLNEFYYRMGLRDGLKLKEAM